MNSKTQHDINWKEMLYLICLCTYIVVFTLVMEGSLLSYIPFMKWEQFVTFVHVINGILVVKILFDIAEEPRIAGVIVLTGAIGFMVYRHNSADMILSVLWFLCAGRNVRPRKITQCLFWSHLFSFVIIEILCVADVIPFGRTVKTGHEAVSYSLGFPHPNMAAAQIMQLVMLFWLLRKGRLLLRHYLEIIVIMIFVKVVTDCGTIVLLMGILLGCTVLYNIPAVTRFLYKKITVVRNLVLAGYLGILGAVMLFFFTCTEKEIFTKMGTIGARIIESIRYYRYYGFSLWGQPLYYYGLNSSEAKKTGLYTLDTGYMYLLLGFGTILFLYFIFLHAGTLCWVFQRKRLDYVILYGIFFAYGFLETQVIRTDMNFTLFYLFGFIWEYYDTKKQLGNSRGKKLWQRN